MDASVLAQDDDPQRFGDLVAARGGAEGLDVDLRPGDVIYAINNEPTATIAALTTALGQMRSGMGS